MATAPTTCVNHRDTPTRLSCSSCDAPICSRCVRPSAVGQRCPSCAKPARAARARGKPEHYLRAVGGGGAVAVGGGLVIALMTLRMTFGSLILSGILGFLVGRAVAWGTRGQTQTPFPAVAAATAVGGLLIAITLVYGTPLPMRGLLPLAYPIAGFFATRGLYR